MLGEEGVGPGALGAPDVKCPVLHGGRALDAVTAGIQQTTPHSTVCLPVPVATPSLS